MKIHCAGIVIPPIIFQIALPFLPFTDITGTASGRRRTLNPNLESMSSRSTRSHITHNPRLYLLQFRRKLIPHPLLNLGSLIARH